MPNTDNITSLLTRQDIWRGSSQSSTRRTVTTGHKSLDRLLHGGWPVGALTELLTQQSGIGELTLLLPMLRHYSGKEQLCVWLDPPYQPYAPSLAAAGIALHRLLIVRSKSPQEWLWAAAAPYSVPGTANNPQATRLCANYNLPHQVVTVPLSYSAQARQAQRPHQLFYV